MTPLYIYEKNGRRIEVMFPRGKAPKRYKGYRRVLSCPAIHFSGPGWTGAMKHS
jgi:hypothetical protein